MNVRDETPFNRALRASDGLLGPALAFGAAAPIHAR